MAPVIEAVVVPSMNLIMAIGPLTAMTFAGFTLLAAWLVSGVAEVFRRVAAREWEQRITQADRAKNDRVAA